MSSKRLSILVFSLIICITLQAQVINYEWPSTIPKSDLYSIRVFQDGEVYDIYPHYSEPYDENNWYVTDREPGDNNGVAGYLADRSMTFGTFAFEGEVWVEVTKLYGSAASSVEIAPKVFGFNPTYFDGRRVRFKINHEVSEIAKYIGVYFVSNDNKDDDGVNGKQIKNSVMIFADKPETDAPKIGDPGVAVFGADAGFLNADIIYIRKGDYNFLDYFNTPFGQEGQMPYVKNNQKIYMEPGTYIRGAFHGQGFDGIGLKGRAIISGHNYPFHWFRDENNKKDAFINFIGCDNISIDGVIIENPSHHTIPSSKNTLTKNLKIIGWSYNQDGIRPSSGGVADQIFIKTNDDYDYARDPHVVKNSVFWPTHNGAVGMVGWNDLGSGFAKYINNAYINCETRNVNNNTGIIGSQAKDGMNLRENYLENLFIEDDNAYLVNLTVTRDGDLSSGGFLDFTFKNITTEHPFQFTNKTKAIQRMNGLENNWITGWTFTNLIVDGILVTYENHSDYFNINLVGTNGINEDADNYVRNVTFDTEGTLYKISSTVGSGGALHPSGSNGEITCIGGRDQSITVEPNPGYRIKSIIVDGEEKYIYGNATKTERMQVIYFKELKADHTISVTYEQGDDFFGPSTGVSNLTGKLENSIVNLVWFDNSSEETGIKVWRKSSGEFTELVGLDSDVVRYQDSDVELEVGYTYKVEAFKGDQSLGQSNEFSLSVVLNTQTMENQIVVFPTYLNAGDVVNAQIRNFDYYQNWRLIDVFGRQIRTGEVQSSSIQIETEGLKGMLLLQFIKYDGKVETHRFIAN